MLRSASLAMLLLSALPAAAQQVTIDNFAFTPAEITVHAGATVTWTNRDDIPHTVTDAAHPPAFRSQALDTDESFQARFPQPGTYRYFCSLHPHMQGIVVVQ